jgi:uncharacterized RDD family membrane protein YckC
LSNESLQHTLKAVGNRPVPSIRRRLAAFIYEGVLLFGVVMIVAYLYGTLTQQRHAMQGQTGLQVALFVSLGVYFVWFWTHGGQTVADKTWHIRVLRADGQPLKPGLATLRYIAAWIWFMPALVTAWLIKPIGPWAVTGLLTLGVVVYALLARMHPQKQFVHDVLCGTQLVDAKPPSKSKG